PITLAELSTLSLHDTLPISPGRHSGPARLRGDRPLRRRLRSGNPSARRARSPGRLGALRRRAGGRRLALSSASRKAWGDLDWRGLIARHPGSASDGRTGKAGATSTVGAAESAP